MICSELPDARKYNYITFPRTDIWGAVMAESHPLAMKKAIKADDLIGVPLFCSEQSWEREVSEWAGDRYAELRMEGSFRLSFNGSMFALEGLGVLLTFEHLVDCSEGSGLVFRPLDPVKESCFYLIWGKHQILTPIAERFLTQIAQSFSR